jgi:multidrug resistance efflux pump
MRRLKPRRELYTLPNQPRSHRQAVIRWVYLASITALAVWLGDIFLGSMLYLRSEGMVLAEPAVIAAEFPVTVREVLVRAGERVEKGRVAAIVSSQHVAESIARLTAELGAREAHVSELRIRSQRADAVLGSAETRWEVAADARRQFDTLLKSGHLPIDKRAAAVESEFRGRQDLEALKAEKRAVNAEITTLGTSLVEAENAINDLRRLYDDGRMRTPIAGIVSRLVADKGSVVRAGDPLIEVYGDQRYVLAYLPTGALYQIAAGDRVLIKAGLGTIQGVVSRVEPFAAALPREFQRAFVPVERQQVIRVEFAPGEEPPPLFAKVELRSAEILPRWISQLWAENGS